MTQQSQPSAREQLTFVSQPPTRARSDIRYSKLAGRQSIPKTNFYLLKVRCCFSNEERFNLDTASCSRFELLQNDEFREAHFPRAGFLRPNIKFQKLPRGRRRRPPKDPSKD